MKLKSALFKEVRKTVKKTLTFKTSKPRKTMIGVTFPKPSYTRTPKQDEQRTGFKIAKEMWNKLDPAEKESWNKKARPLKITGYNLYIRENIKCPYIVFDDFEDGRYENRLKSETDPRCKYPTWEVDSGTWTAAAKYLKGVSPARISTFIDEYTDTIEFLFDVRIEAVTERWYCNFNIKEEAGVKNYNMRYIVFVASDYIYVRKYLTDIGVDVWERTYWAYGTIWHTIKILFNTKDGSVKVYADDEFKVEDGPSTGKFTELPLKNVWFGFEAHVPGETGYFDNVKIKRIT